MCDLLFLLSALSSNRIGYRKTILFLFRHVTENARNYILCRCKILLQISQLMLMHQMIFAKSLGVLCQSMFCLTFGELSTGLHNCFHGEFCTRMPTIRRKQAVADIGSVKRAEFS